MREEDKASPFIPRLIEGSVSAPRVVFLDRLPIASGNMFDWVGRALDETGEAVIAIRRYGISDGYRQLCKDYPAAELPDFGVPDAVRIVGRSIHTVCVCTLPPPWETGQVRSYALSAAVPTIAQGALVHRWLTGLGADASNQLLWRRETR